MRVREPFFEILKREHGSLEASVPYLIKALRKDDIVSRLNLQVVWNALGEEEKAFLLSNEMLSIDPHDPRVLFNRGWHLIKRRRLQEGFKFLEFGRLLNTYGSPALESIRPLWKAQSGSGQTVHLALEGGLGDEIIHFRFAKTLVEKYHCKVNVICSPALAPLFVQAPWVSAVIQRAAAGGVYHDSWLPGMSAALALGLEHKDLCGEAYVPGPNMDRQKKWDSLLGRISPRHENRPLRVGLRWAGNPRFEHQQLRKFSPQLLLALADIPGIQAYSFQRDDDLVQLPSHICDLGPWLSDWEDTAAALLRMDLVISSCTSVAHMSAALGQKTWVVVPALPYFIWAPPGDKSDWYDSVRLFRQGQFGSWDDVARNLGQSLKEFRADN